MTTNTMAPISTTSSVDVTDNGMTKSSFPLVSPPAHEIRNTALLINLIQNIKFKCILAYMYATEYATGTFYMSLIPHTS